MIWLTALIGAFLAGAGIIRGWGPNDVGTFVIVLVLGLVAVLEAWLLTWATLGSHTWVRLPFALIGIVLIGLLPPYCFGWRGTGIIEWPYMSVATAVWMLPSLVVIRSCGYRLVRSTKAYKHKVAEISE